jgi:DNA-binding XRE family transcriptional regulator
MKRPVTIILTVLLLAALGAAALLSGLFQRRMAVAQEDMAVLDFVDPEADYVALEADLARIPWASGGAVKEIRQRRALLQYWQGDYADLIEVARTTSQNTEDQAIDPEMQLLAANALYRVAQLGSQDRATLLKNLDAAIRAYADALRAGSEQPDAAFNYELAVRMRAEITAGRRKMIANPKVDNTKSEPNMHGDPGEPPKEMKVEQFQIRIPMDPREIKNSQETAGTGAQRRRRG